MYSWEIEQFLKANGYRLNISQVQLLIDSRENPQITSFKYNEEDKSCEIWTQDEFYFKFNVIGMEEYYHEIQSIIKEFNRTHGVSYRLYTSLKAAPIKMQIVSSDIDKIFRILDLYILEQEVSHSTYMIMKQEDNTDELIYLGYGNKVDYLNFKDRMKTDSLKLAMTKKK